MTPAQRIAILRGAVSAAAVDLNFSKNVYRLKGLTYPSFPALSGASYTRTGTETAPDSTGALHTFAANVPAITDLGMQVWEARTNNILWSQDFTNSAWSKLSGGTGALPVVTGNYATAPDGTLTASRIQFDLGATPASATSRIYQGPGTFATSTNSVFLRTNDGTTKTLYLVGQNSGTAITVTPVWKLYSGINAVGGVGYNQVQFGLSGLTGAAGLTTSTTADILAWGGMSEAASTPGPYIPTTNAAATRGAASAFLAGLSLPSEYTLYAEGSVPVLLGADRTLAALDANSTTNRVQLFVRGSDGLVMIEVDTGGVNQVYYGDTYATAGGTIRAAVRVRTNDVAISVNGGAAATTTTVALPAVTRLGAGMFSTGTTPLNGILRRVMVLPYAATNAQLQALTAP